MEILRKGHPFREGDAALEAFVRGAVTQLSAYFGGLPVHQLRVVASVGGDEFHGKTYGRHGGGTIFWSVPEAARVGDLRKSWVLMHELVHLALPSVDDEQHWAEEGLATYIEPFIRVRAGEIDEAEVWRQLLDGVPDGLNAAKAQGLDASGSWATTYWGGCLFWLLADVTLREQSHNQRSLERGLRALRSGGASIEQDASLASVLQQMDRALGGTTLQSLYARLGPQPFSVDLPALWKRLGVERRGNVIHFVDTPLSAVRRSMSVPTGETP